VAFRTAKRFGCLGPRGFIYDDSLISDLNVGYSPDPNCKPGPAALQLFRRTNYESATAWHGAPRIDCEVEQCQLNLIGIDKRRWQRARKLAFVFDVDPPCAKKQRLHAANEFAEIHRLWFEFLAARYSSRRPASTAPPSCGLNCIVQQSAGAVDPRACIFLALLISAETKMIAIR
jgi:hypothetical protein